MDNELLLQLHEAELEIMDEVHRICEKCGIEYFLDSGSALGAIRHSGFIPWDDDMDIGMLREDYDRFLEIAPNELKSGFTIQNHETDSAVHKFYTKIRKDNTFYPSKISGKYKHQGIAIDVFPFDYVSDDDKYALKQLNMYRKLYKIIVLKDKDRKSLPIWKKAVHCIVSLLDSNKLRKKCNLIFKEYNDKKTNRITCYAYHMSLKMDLFFEVDKIIPTIPINFEGREYRIMNDYDYYLRTMYGDYMAMPPEEKRKYPDLRQLVLHDYKY